MNKKKWDQSEVEHMIDLHKMWLEGAEDGVRANVERGDFTGLDFSWVSSFTCDSI